MFIVFCELYSVFYDMNRNVYISMMSIKNSNIKVSNIPTQISKTTYERLNWPGGCISAKMCYLQFVYLKIHKNTGLANI